MGGGVDDRRRSVTLVHRTVIDTLEHFVVESDNATKQNIRTMPPPGLQICFWPSVTVTFDLLTTKLDRFVAFMPLPREPQPHSRPKLYVEAWRRHHSRSTSIV